MSNQNVLVLLLLGIAVGMVYGRWRYERLRARIAAKKAWNERHKNTPNTWHPW